MAGQKVVVSGLGFRASGLGFGFDVLELIPRSSEVQVSA